MLLFRIILLFCMLTLFACSGVKKVKNEQSSVIVKSKEEVILDKKIEDIAKDIYRKVNIIAGMEQAKSTQKLEYVFSSPKDYPELNKKIRLNWNGYAEKAVEIIAKMIGYKFEVEGHRNLEITTVSIHSENDTAFKILQDIGWQLGDNVGIIVNAVRKKIKFVYRAG